MSAFSDLITPMAGLVSYIPVEANGTAVVGPDATLPGGTAAAPTLVAGGAGALNFAAASGSAVGVSAMTFPKPLAFGGWVRFGGFPASGTPTVLGWNNGLPIGVRNTGKLLAPSGVTAIENFSTGTNYLIGASWDDGEWLTYYNGRLARVTLAPTLSQSGTALPVIGGPALNAVVGHWFAFNRRLGAGEWLALFKAGNPTYNSVHTDPFESTSIGMPATGTVDVAAGMFGGRGRRITAGSPRPSITVAVSGNTVVTAHHVNPAVTPVERCMGKLCGGMIFPNEAHVRLKPLAGQTQGSPIHVACLLIDKPGVPQPQISSIATPTIQQYMTAATRMIRDQIASKVVKTIGNGTGNGGRAIYLSINERQHETSWANFPDAAGTAPNGAGAYVSPQIANWTRPNAPGQAEIYNYAESAVAAAVLHRYYDLPANSWTRTYAELLTDQYIAQFQDPSGSFQDGSGNDFYFPMLGLVTKMLGPYMDTAKYNTWVSALTAHANWAIGSTTGVVAGFFCINSNRNLQNMLGVWMTYLVTGNARWKRAFEMQYKLFCGGMPAVGGLAAAPARGTYQTMPTPAASGIPGAVTGDWSSGGNTNVFNGVPLPRQEPDHKPYGYYTVRAGGAGDGSDSIGFLSEAHGTGVDTGADQNYLSYMLMILGMMLPVTDYDPRIVYLSNALLNYLWPYVDKAGGNVWTQDDSDRGTLGGALEVNNVYSGPFTLDVQGGVRGYGYAGQLFITAMVHALQWNGRRSSKPSGVPAAIHPGGTAPSAYGPAYYSPYEDFTPTILKNLWVALETYYDLAGASGPQEPARWKELGKTLSMFLLNDPGFTVPTTPGRS